MRASLLRFLFHCRGIFADLCDRAGVSSRDQQRRSCEGEAAMRIGVPKEIKVHEYRVGLVPAAARELVEAGHQVTANPAR